MTDEIQRCYRVLGLTPGEPFEVVKRVYRKLLKEWHPDHFHNDSQLSLKGNERLKALIPAYERLAAFHSGLFSETLSSASTAPTEEIRKTPQEQYEMGYAFAQQFDYAEAAKWF